MLCDDILLVYFDFEMWLHTVYCCQLSLHTLDTPLVALALARFMSGGNGQKSCDLSFGVRESGFFMVVRHCPWRAAGVERFFLFSVCLLAYYIDERFL